MASAFANGLVVGLLVGSAATFVALEKPWQRGKDEVSEVSIDAGVELAADDTKGKRGKRGRRGRRGQGDKVEMQVIDERVQLSAADRKMVWRGPAVALPESSVDFSGGGGGRSLDQGEINDAVRARSSTISQCIADARGQAELAAQITLKFLVNGKGGVDKIRVHAPSYLLKNGLYDCAGSAVRRMPFPATGGHTVVTVPFDLSY